MLCIVSNENNMSDLPLYDDFLLLLCRHCDVICGIGIVPIRYQQ